MVKTRHNEWREHRRQQEALRNRIAQLDESLRTTKRNRRNLRAYNDMLERREETVSLCRIVLRLWKK